MNGRRAGRAVASRLLLAGAVAGPLFLAVVLVQAFTREGFNPARHPLSSLALGPLGWAQVANFVICGMLTIAGAVGLRRALQPGRASTWGPWLVGVGGAALVVAGVFPADPINGYPPGAADSATWHGVVHSTAPALAGIAGLVGYAVFARRFAADREYGWLTWTIATPVGIVATNAAAAATADFRLTMIAQLVGAAWTTSLCLKLRRAVRSGAAGSGGQVERVGETGQEVAGPAQHFDHAGRDCPLGG